MYKIQAWSRLVNRIGTNGPTQEVIQVTSGEKMSGADLSGDANKTIKAALTLDELRGITNADRIRAMGDEELAGFLKRVKNRTLIAYTSSNMSAIGELVSEDWLRSETKEETE